MSVFVSGASAKDFTPAPEGAHQAVCVDVVDLGVLETTWGPKHKLDIRWQISEDMEDGKPFLVSKRYTASLNEKATLRHDLESWRGKAFTDAELMKFDVEVLIGVNCLLNVIHKAGTKNPAKMFARIATVTPLVKGMTKIEARDYIREKDRTDTPTPDETRTDEDEDRVPF